MTGTFDSKGYQGHVQHTMYMYIEGYLIIELEGTYTQHQNQPQGRKQGMISICI